MLADGNTNPLSFTFEGCDVAHNTAGFGAICLLSAPVFFVVLRFPVYIDAGGGVFVQTDGEYGSVSFSNLMLSRNSATNGASC